MKVAKIHWVVESWNTDTQNILKTTMSVDFFFFLFENSESNYVLKKKVSIIKKKKSLIYLLFWFFHWYVGIYWTRMSNASKSIKIIEPYSKDIRIQASVRCELLNRLSVISIMFTPVAIHVYLYSVKVQPAELNGGLNDPRNHRGVVPLDEGCRGGRGERLVFYSIPFHSIISSAMRRYYYILCNHNHNRWGGGF